MVRLSEEPGTPTTFPQSPPAVAAREMPPVRVVHVVYGLDAGGMELGVIKLVNGLNVRRVQSAICSTRPGGKLRSFVNAAVPVFEFHRRNGNDPLLVWQLFRLFARHRPDVVHTHAWGTLIEGLLAARLARVPVVIHGEHGTLQLRSYQRWLQRRAWTAADQVLSVSTRLAERIAGETGFPIERIRSIRNGVDLSRFGQIDRATARQHLGLQTEGPIIVTVGRLVPVKDHLTLLDAVATLCRDGVAARLVIAGDGPLKGAITQRAVALGLPNAIRLLGHRPDVETVLAAGDVFVLSSISEGLSNTILEAMASSLPVVATRVGGADEMVIHGETGLLVPAGSDGEMATALGTMLADPNRGRLMGIAGRARAEAEFSLHSMVSRYEALYVEAATAKISRGMHSRSSEPGAAHSGVA